LKNDLQNLYEDEEVTNDKGIFLYLLSGKEKEKIKHLNIRTFDASIKKAVFKNQKGHCARCNKSIEYNSSHADHIEP